MRASSTKELISWQTCLAGTVGRQGEFFEVPQDSFSLGRQYRIKNKRNLKIAENQSLEVRPSQKSSYLGSYRKQQWDVASLVAKLLKEKAGF